MLSKYGRNLLLSSSIVVGILVLTVGVVLAASTVIDNGDTSDNWVSSDTTNSVVSQETTIKQEGTGSVKVQTTAEATTPISCQTYTVQKGDTLWKIAKEKFDNPFLYGNLMAGNQEQYPSLLTNPENIKIGWKLKLNCDDKVEEFVPDKVPTNKYQTIWKTIRDFFSKLIDRNKVSRE